jgi:hypothetical protein
VKRNPYHVIMPAWLMDNVRRGGELGRTRERPHRIFFATIYRLRQWDGREFTPLWQGGRFLSRTENPGHLFDC